MFCAQYFGLPFYVYYQLYVLCSVVICAVCAYL